MDRRALIALIICGVIMLLYYPVILPLMSPKTKELKHEKAAAEERVEIKTETPALLTSRDALPELEIPEEEVMIENEYIRTIWSNNGAALKSIKLKTFKKQDAKDTLELIKDVDTEYRPLAISYIHEKANFQKQRYRVIDRSKGRISFSTSLENGVNLIKTVSLPEGKYHVDMEIVLENNTDTEISLSYDIIASSMIMHEGEISTDIAGLVGVDMENDRIKLVRTAPKGFPAKNESRGIVWMGSTNKYFAVILKPASSEWIASVNSQAFDMQGLPAEGKAEHGDFMVGLQTGRIHIAPHTSVRHGYLYFAGPKREEVLRQYNTMDAIISYGWLNAISKLLLGFLNAVHHAIPNYGISIIVLTIIIKALLFPLTRKSQVSMFRMQQLQPLINQLKEKYKNNKQKIGQEQVLLFKKYGVNPMSGCLPMLLQIPVFFALFRTLQLSFEMRQAPFLFWINDLSMPDTFMYLPFTIPFLGNTLNILPIIMTGASFAQMKLTPKSPATDPQAQAQQKMMSLMPIMFAFILYKMPSGLTLYWTTSTLFSIVESVFIRKSIKKIKIV
ncbi:MAG: membrane protein insertase YidC [Planctomycetes bacterium]|nr:membrane protein insertase YidC [Planctomycetota bacterium]